MIALAIAAVAFTLALAAAKFPISSRIGRDVAPFVGLLSLTVALVAAGVGVASLVLS